MKITFLITINILLILILGCTNQTTETNTNLNDSTINKEITDTISDITEEKSYDEIGNELINSETIWGINTGITSNDVTKKIGYPDEKSTAEEWGSDGQIHQTWKYAENNLELNMVGAENSEQVVFSIYVMAPSDLKTSRNIGIGSTLNEVNTKYAKEIDKSQSSEFSVVAGSIYAGIIFTLENKKVTSIFIGASAE